MVKKFLSLEGFNNCNWNKEEKLEELKKTYPKIKTLKFDISEHSKIEEFIDKASSELDGIDILINNAGITVDNLSLRMKE